MRRGHRSGGEIEEGEGRAKRTKFSSIRKGKWAYNKLTKEFADVDRDRLHVTWMDGNSGRGAGGRGSPSRAPMTSRHASFRAEVQFFLGRVAGLLGSIVLIQYPSSLIAIAICTRKAAEVHCCSR